MGQYIAIQRRMCHSENAHLPERRFFFQPAKQAAFLVGREPEKSGAGGFFT